MGCPIWGLNMWGNIPASVKPEAPTGVQEEPERWVDSIWHMGYLNVTKAFAL